MFYLRELHFSLLAMGKDRGTQTRATERINFFPQCNEYGGKSTLHTFVYVCEGAVYGGVAWAARKLRINDIERGVKVTFLYSL